MEVESAGQVDPLVYILIVNWRGWRDTVDCLESVFRHDYRRFRVIVCNNDPNDDSVARIAEWGRQAIARGVMASEPGASPQTRQRPDQPPEVVVLKSRTDDDLTTDGDAPALLLVETGSNRGFAGGNNVGLRYIEQYGDADYVWLLNNDTVVGTDALRRMVDLAESRTDAGMVGSKLMHHDRPDVIQAVAGGRISPWTAATSLIGMDEPDSGQWNEVLEVEYVTGASLLVRMTTIAEIGPLDERYFLYSEEVDWGLRARQRGWKLLYAPGSKVWHKGGQSVGYGSALHDYYSVRSSLLLVQKFHPARLPFALAYSLYRYVAPKLIRRQFGRLRAVLRAYRDFARMILFGRYGGGGPQFVPVSTLGGIEGSGD